MKEKEKLCVQNESGIEYKGSKSGRRRTGKGRIAGQSMKKDSAATLLFKLNNENFAELFNRTMPFEEPLSPDELQDEDIKEIAYIRITREDGGTSLVQYRDVVKSIRNGRIFAILGIENQSEIDYAMPFRILEVDFINYARQMQRIRDRHNAEWRTPEGNRHVPEGVSAGEYLGRFLKTDRLERCETLVLYWGKEPWDGPMKFSDLFKGDAKAVCTVQLEMNLLDVCRMTDEEICRYSGELRAVFGFRKHADDKKALRSFIDTNQEFFSSVSQTAVDALVELTHSPELKGILTQEYAAPEGGVNMCKAIQGMIQDGRLEGIQEGIQEGIKRGRGEGEIKAKKEIAVSLSAMGMSVEKIAEATKVGIDTVKEWLSAAVK